MGFRKGLIKVLQRRGIDFALWSEKEVPAKYLPQFSLISDFPHVTAELESKVTGWGGFTHVVACVESAVYPASLIRRPLKARLTKDSVILRGHDKIKMKQYLSEFDIPMTEFLPGDAPLSAEDIIAKLGSPVVVKTRSLSGGRGMCMAKSPAELKAYQSSLYIFERYIKGTESSVESFIQDGQVQFHNITYYRTPGFTNILPSHQSVAECAEIQKLNEKIISSLGLQWGISHVEVYNTAEGPLFGELALRPPGGYLMELLSLSYGFDAWEAFLAVELGEEYVFNSKIQAWSASMVLHPGEGYFEKIKNLAKVEELESIKTLQLKKGSDKFIPARKGVGEEIGHALLSHLSQQKLLEDLSICERELQFEKRAQT